MVLFSFEIITLCSLRDIFSLGMKTISTIISFDIIFIRSSFRSLTRRRLLVPIGSSSIII